jgi:hypothetical protein
MVARTGEKHLTRLDHATDASFVKRADAINIGHE